MIGEDASRKGETYLNGIGLTTLAAIHDCGAMLRKLESDRVVLLQNEDCFKEILDLYERTVIFINELNASSGHIGDVYEGFFRRFKEKAELLKENLEEEMEEKFVIKGKEKQMKSEEKINKIARLCHEVNRVYCNAIGDFSHKSWEETPEELQNSVKAGVVNNLLKDLTPRQSHEEWVKYRSERGWVYGKEKDLEKKTHPCMVDYDDLPPERKTKNEFFNFICGTFKSDGRIRETPPSDFGFNSYDRLNDLKKQ